MTHHQKHPDWLKITLPNDPAYFQVSQIIKKENLSTVCKEARCPNQSECFSSGTATFLIMGNTCTRNCGYCNIHHSSPTPLDPEEPRHIASAIQRLNLPYAVITSVTRDDLPDHGADHFAKTITQIKASNPHTKVEILTPDFQNNLESIQTVINAGPDVFNHNIEVVRSLFPHLRPEGNYSRSLKFLKTIKKLNPSLITKSGLMIGLGERINEVYETLNDLKAQNVDIITIGQYLQPRRDLAPVTKYYTPAKFAQFKTYAESLKFTKVFSGPKVRSSYHAEETLQ